MSLVHDGIATKNMDLEPDFRGWLVAILTRFNMAIDSFRTKPSTNDMREWTKKRSEIFVSFTLPSVLNQKRRPRYWFIGFDGNSRDDVSDLITTLDQYPWIIPVWQSPSGASLARFSDAVSQRIEGDDTHVLSVRMDNDDAIHEDFLENLVSYARLASNKKMLEDYWITFPFGAQFDGANLRASVYAANTFLARVQTVDNFASSANPTALRGRHETVYERGTVFQALTAEPMWIVNVHGDNVRNKMNNRLPRLFATAGLMRRFGVSVQ